MPNPRSQRFIPMISFFVVVNQMPKMVFCEILKDGSEVYLAEKLHMKEPRNEFRRTMKEFLPTRY